MCIAAEVIEYSMSTSKRRFGVDDPFGRSGCIDKISEPIGIDEMFEFAEELKSVTTEGALELSEKQ